jgi:nucleoside-diphosphate-sugar epimerase
MPTVKLVKNLKELCFLNYFLKLLSLFKILPALEFYNSIRFGDIISRIMGISKSKTALVTGANGFIWTNLIKLLLNKNFKVHALVRKNADLLKIESFKKNIRIHEGDIRDQKFLNKIIKNINPDYIFHFAAYGNSSIDANLDEMINVNIVGLKNLLQATLNINYKAFVITGSSSEYGFKKKPMKESNILEPNSFYSATKAAATLLAQSFATINSKPVRIVRPFSVYGPFEEKNRLVPIVINSAMNNKQIFVTPGKVKRDFIYVEDVVEAILKVAKTKLKNGEIINLGTGIQTDNKEVVKIIGKIMGKKLNVKVGNFVQKPWDTNYWVADRSKAQKLLNWKPKYTLESGLRETITFYKKNNE